MRWGSFQAQSINAVVVQEAISPKKMRREWTEHGDEDSLLNNEVQSIVPREIGVFFGKKAFASFPPKMLYLLVPRRDQRRGTERPRVDVDSLRSDERVACSLWILFLVIFREP